MTNIVGVNIFTKA